MNGAALANPKCLDAIAQHPALCQSAPPAARDGGSTTLEEQLQAIWELAFDLAPISTQDDFFELGGHSAVAMAIFASIRERLGRGLPIATIFRAPTIASLAAVLRTEGEDRFSCLVPALKGEGRSLFIVHGLSGTVLELTNLLQGLRSGRPVSVLQAKGLDPAAKPHLSVEAMAAHYLDEVHAFQPNGPYSLCGFSFGGLVAYEMARRLVAEGETVELLALIDTDIYPRHISWAEWCAYCRGRCSLLRRNFVTSPWRALATEVKGIVNAMVLRLGLGPHWENPGLAGAATLAAAGPPGLRAGLCRLSASAISGLGHLLSRVRAKSPDVRPARGLAAAGPPGSNNARGRPRRTRAATSGRQSGCGA